MSVEDCFMRDRRYVLISILEKSGMRVCMPMILTGCGDAKMAPYTALVVKSEHGYMYTTRTTYGMHLCESWFDK